MNTESGILLSEFVELSRRIAKVKGKGSLCFEGSIGETMEGEIIEGSGSVVEIYWQDENGKRTPMGVDELKGILR